jgi:hypothetical protein
LEKPNIPTVVYTIIVVTLICYSAFKSVNRNLKSTYI